MEICLGMIGMSPEDFWSSSIKEVYAAIDGFMEFHGAKSEQPMARTRLEEMMELYPDE